MRLATRSHLFAGILLCALLLSSTLSAQTRRIEVKLNGLADSALVLGYYLGEAKYVADSAKMDAQGEAIFAADSTLMPGMYLVLMPTGSYFDLMMGKDQKFSVAVDPEAPISSAKVKGSELVKDFFDLQRHLISVRERFTEVSKLDSVARAEGGEKFQETKAYKQAQELREKLDKEFAQYNKEVIKKHSDDILGKFVLSTTPVEIPEFNIPANVKNKDSARWMDALYYNANHYLDNVDLAYYPLLRTPVTIPKVDFYLDKVLLQIPDTISKYVDKVIERAEPNEDCYRFWVSHMLNKYQTSEVVGMDAVFVHVADKYYLSGKTPWVSEELIGKIKKRVENIRPNLLGKVAPDFTMETLEGMENPASKNKEFQLSKQKAKATVILFWEPSCSHCQHALPKIDSIMQHYEPLGVKVVAVMTQGDGPKWQEYVHKHKIEHWINVWDPYRKSRFTENYDIYSTPVIYVLDKDRKIYSKRIGYENLGPILDDLLGTEISKKKPEKP